MVALLNASTRKCSRAPTYRHGTITSHEEEDGAMEEEDGVMEEEDGVMEEMEQWRTNEQQVNRNRTGIEGKQ